MTEAEITEPSRPWMNAKPRHDKAFGDSFRAVRMGSDRRVDIRTELARRHATAHLYIDRPIGDGELRTYRHLISCGAPSLRALIAGMLDTADELERIDRAVAEALRRPVTSTPAASSAATAAPSGCS